MKPSPAVAAERINFILSLLRGLGDYVIDLPGEYDAVQDMVAKAHNAAYATLDEARRMILDISA